MQHIAAYRGTEAQRYALEPPPYGAGWPEVAYAGDVSFMYEKDPYEPGTFFNQARVGLPPLAYITKAKPCREAEPHVTCLILSLTVTSRARARTSRAKRR